MTNSLPPSHGTPPTDNKPLLWILAAVAAVVVFVVVLSAACRSTSPNTPTPQPQPSVAVTSAAPQASNTSAPTPSVASTSPVATWPSEDAKAKYLTLIASIDPSLVGTQSSVDSLIGLGITTCSYLDEAVRVSDDPQEVVMGGMEMLVRSLTLAGFDKDQAIKIAATILNSAISAMCPQHKALLTVALAPEGTPA